jgi:hypothetical protein
VEVGKWLVIVADYLEEGNSPEDIEEVPFTTKIIIQVDCKVSDVEDSGSLATGHKPELSSFKVFI